MGTTMYGPPPQYLSKKAAGIRPRSLKSAAEDTRTMQGWSSPARSRSKPPPRSTMDTVPIIHDLLHRFTVWVSRFTTVLWCSIYIFYLAVDCHTVGKASHCPSRHLQKPALGPLQSPQFSCGRWVRFQHHGKPKGRIVAGRSLEWILFLIQSFLVGGWATPLKNIWEVGWLFPVYGKIKNVPNHQPVLDLSKWNIKNQESTLSPMNSQPAKFQATMFAAVSVDYSLVNWH